MSSRLLDDLGALREFGREGDGVSRLAWSPELEDALDWCARLMEDAGLSAERDGAGNLIGRWSAGSGPAVLAGSHLDTVPAGGAFDGALGVLGAVEAVRYLKESGLQPERPIWVAAFMDEEGVRFGSSMLGSRAFAGEEIAPLADCADEQGTTVREAMSAVGRRFDEAERSAAVKDVGHYLELHVEQGPVLEEAGRDLGIVTEVTGVAGLRVRFDGAARHAGTTPMTSRRDALVTGAAFITGVRELAVTEPDLRATVGDLEVHPGASNVVPGAAVLSVDLRASTEEALDRAEEKVRALAGRIADEQGLGHQALTLFRHGPVPMDSDLTDLLESTAADLGATTLRLPSGAGHDAMVIGRHLPAGMLFVPSRDGISHSPAEFSEGPLCDLGAKVLAIAIRRLAGGRTVAGEIAEPGGRT